MATRCDCTCLKVFCIQISEPPNKSNCQWHKDTSMSKPVSKLSGSMHSLSEGCFEESWLFLSFILALYVSFITYFKLHSFILLITACILTPALYLRVQWIKFWILILLFHKFVQSNVLRVWLILDCHIGMPLWCFIRSPAMQRYCADAFLNITKLLQVMGPFKMHKITNVLHITWSQCMAKIWLNKYTTLRRWTGFCAQIWHQLH